MNGQKRILTGASIFTGGAIIEDHAVVLEGADIVAVLSASSVPSDGQIERLPRKDALLAPGLIDAQVNGAGGVLFNETPTAEATLAIGKALRPFGVTGYLPTLITDKRENMGKACAAVVKAVSVPGSGVLGVHLEGPFIGPSRPGVHDPQYIRSPEEEDFRLLEATAAELKDCPLLVTLAPETVSEEGITRLVRAGAIVSVGHTGATYDQVTKALAAGASGFTHLFNAMPPIVNREPGPVGAALASRNTYCGIIADGFHVHPAMLATAVKSKTPGELFLVSDAMPPVGTDATEFILYGQTIYRRGGRLVTANDVLAGADIDMLAAVRNCVTMLGMPLEEALRMASLYPARFLKLDHLLGSIAPNRRADLVLLTNWKNPATLGVAATWVEGKKES